METTRNVFEFRYNIQEMIPLPGDMLVYVVTQKGPGDDWASRAIALARVSIVKFNILKRFEAESWQALRYVILDEENRPYVSYEEDLNEKFVEIRVIDLGVGK